MDREKSAKKPSSRKSTQYQEQESSASIQKMDSKPSLPPSTKYRTKSPNKKKIYSNLIKIVEIYQPSMTYNIDD